jgi:hypothetical protein
LSNTAAETVLSLHYPCFTFSQGVQFMPNFKCVFQFTQPNKGWTETYYRTGADLASAANFPQSLIASMTIFRDPLTILQKCRVSDVLNNRVSIPVTIAQNGTRTSTGPEAAGLAAVVTLLAPQFGASRKVWLRGIIDLDFARSSVSGVDVPSGSLIQAINSFINQLSTNGFVIRSLTKLGPPPNNYITINSVGIVAGAGQVTLNTVAGPVYNPGTQLIINQVNQKVLPGLKGIFSVISSTATTVVIPYNGTVTEVLTLQKGRFRVATYNYGAMVNTGAGFSNFSTRSTGKNPLGGRGAKRGARGIRSA